MRQHEHDPGCGQIHNIRAIATRGQPDGNEASLQAMHVRFFREPRGKNPADEVTRMYDSHRAKVAVGFA